MSKSGYVASANGFCIAINAPVKKSAKASNKDQTKAEKPSNKS